jgi:hypothetical protein
MRAAPKSAYTLRQVFEFRLLQETDGAEWDSADQLRLLRG